MAMAARARPKLWLIALSVLTLFLVAIAIAIALFNPAITRYVEGPEFRAELEKQTAKGLHFESSKFAPIRRTGFLTGATDQVRTHDGRKALTALDAYSITA